MRRPAFTLLIVACTITATAALAQTARPFGATAVPCNSGEMSNCRVSFNGSSATRSYMHVRGGQTTSTHGDCTVSGNRISCGPGRWTTDKGFSGSAGTLVINLNGAGRPTGTGH